MTDEEREELMELAEGDTDTLKELASMVKGEHGIVEASEAENPKTANTALQAYGNKGESEGEVLARYALMPEVGFAHTYMQYQKKPFSGEVDINCIVQELQNQTAAVRKGDLSRAEDMLVAQAHTLDRLFNTLVARSAANMGTYNGTADMYMKMALKSQAQCRATIEALSSIKNPSVVKANQLNMAHNQQVNNAPLTGETKNTPTQLLEKTDGQRLDTPKTQETVGVDSPMETLEPVHRADINGG